MADEKDKPTRKLLNATPAILAFTAILAAAPTLGMAEALTQHGNDLTENERVVLGSLTTEEVTALTSINTQLDQVVAAAANNNNNNNNKKAAA
jgi:hypothetical protein